LVNDLDDHLFQKAIVSLCKEKEQWWPTDNVPGMIRARVVDMEIIEWEQKQIEEDKKYRLDFSKSFYRKVLKSG